MDFRKNLIKRLHQYGSAGNALTIRRRATITRIIEQLSETVGPISARKQIWEVLNQMDKELRPNWLIRRLTPGPLYAEGYQVFGWASDNQVLAKRLPIEHSRYYVHDSEPHYIDKWIVEHTTPEDRMAGFIEPTRIPLIHNQCCLRGSYVEVDFPVEETFFWAEYGFALPCDLQWYYSNDGYRVTRSIKEHGFWEAWKYWDKARYFYLKHKPELLVDLDIWGKLRYEPENDPYAAVLGGQNKKLNQNCAKTAPK